MDLILTLVDFTLHLDLHLASFIQMHGAWVYALLFGIVFVETGLVVMPFLPGDSLLFMVGTLGGAGTLNWRLAVLVLMAAAIAGDQLNFSLGRFFGDRVHAWQGSRWFSKSAYDAAHRFYLERGGMAIVLARFMPFVRTFAPFVAGVAGMRRQQFSVCNVLGALLWVSSICLAGACFGKVLWVKQHLSVIIVSLVLVPSALPLLAAMRRRAQAA